MSPLSWANLTSNKFKTTALINLAGIMERMDEQILPALYNFIGHSFQATPSQFGLAIFVVQVLRKSSVFQKIQMCEQENICNAGQQSRQSLWRAVPYRILGRHVWVFVRNQPW